MKMAVLENVIHKVKITLNGSQAVFCPLSVPLGVKSDIQFSVTGLCNSLPCNLKQTDALNQFKQLLNLHFG